MLRLISILGILVIVVGFVLIGSSHYVGLGTVVVALGIGIVFTSELIKLNRIGS